VAIAYIGMGGNMASAAGEPAATLVAAVARMRTLGRVTARSRLYSTEPVGFARQPRFVNAVVALDTKLGPRKLLHGLMQIEQEFGRERTAGFANGPRTLDLDILLYGDVVMEQVDLRIPHPRLTERAFVLMPLADIAPELVEPRSGRTVAELLARLCPDPGEDSDAVVPLESSLWLAGVGEGLLPGAEE
jgi:2-amino-4-hydroxy-6-hydroxymethyldihydropteridine diphosphokinase